MKTRYMKELAGIFLLTAALAACGSGGGGGGGGPFLPVAKKTSVNLPRTGQTICYDVNGDVIPCADTGQDGDTLVGVASSPRFTAGTGAESKCVTDNLTGLMWTKDAAATQAWAGALTYANDLSLCGHTDWRLPNRKELRSLVNYGEGNIAAWLNTQGFTNAQDDHYWSSTTYAGNTTLAWAVSMSDGSMYYRGKATGRYVWPVRSGQ